MERETVGQARRLSYCGRLAALFLLLAAPAGAFVVTVHDAEVSGREIRLGDVVTLGGVHPAAAAEIAAMRIGTAPAPGRERMIPIETVRMHLLRAGFLPNQLVLEGVRPPVVRRPGRIISSEEVGRAVLERLKGEADSGMKLSVTRVSALPMLPPGPLVFEIKPINRLGRNTTVSVEVSVGGETARAYVTLTAVRPGVVVVAARHLMRGAILTAGDLTTRSADLLAVPADAILDQATLVGRVLTRTVPEDAVMTASVAEEETLVRRGDRVQLVASIPGMELRLVGEALEAGRLGGLVRVRNPESKRIVTGRVTGVGEVMVVE